MCKRDKKKNDVSPRIDLQCSGNIPNRSKVNRVIECRLIRNWSKCLCVPGKSGLKKGDYTLPHFNEFDLQDHNEIFLAIQI